MLILVGSLMAVPGPAKAVVPGDHVNVRVSEGTLAGITTNLPLSPSFSTSIHDYIIRCQSGVNNVRLSLMGTGRITVDQESGRTVTVTVPLGENQAVVVTASSGPYWIRCLPQDFPQMQFERPGNPPEGWYLTGSASGAPDGSSSAYAMVLDDQGTPVWYQKAPGGAIDTRLLSGNKIGWAPILGPGIGANPNGGFNLYDLDDQTSETVKTPLGPTDPHELLEVASGNRFMIATPTLPKFGRTIVDCIIEEVGPDGSLVWSWRASDHIVPEESTHPITVPVNGQPADDIYHCNSIDLDPATDPPDADVLISVRHTDSLYLIDKTTGAIRWKLGGNAAGSEPHLRISGGRQNDFSGPHDARFRGGNGISVYDDQSFSQSGTARGVEYAIDEEAGTAQLAWEYEAPDGQKALAMGGFRRYANGADNVIAWGLKNGAGGFDEVDGDGNLLFRMSFPRGEAAYRVVKEAPGALDVDLLRRTAGLPRPKFPTVSWRPLGGVLTSKPAVASWAPNRLDAFVRGTDNQMWHLWWVDGTWYGWEPLGGLLTSGPGVASWSEGRLNVFVKGTDQQLWHKAWDGSAWHEWQPLGGFLTSAPAVTSWGPGRLDVVVAGINGELWHRSFDGPSGWSGWASLGGATRDDPAITSWGKDRIDVFVRGTDQQPQLWHKWSDGSGWHDWAPAGRNLTTGVSATSLGAGLIDVGAGGANGMPQRLPFNGTWQVWQPLGGATDYPPALVAVGSNEERVFATGILTNGLWEGRISEPLSPSPVNATDVSPPSAADVARL